MRKIDALVTDVSFAIRPAIRDKDIDGLAYLLARVFYGGIPTSPNFDFVRSYSRADALERFNGHAPGDVIFVAVDKASGKVVGCVECVVDSSWAPPKRGRYAHLGRCLYVSTLGVLPEFRRRGIAKALMERCEELAVAQHYSYMFLHVEKNNAAAVRMYDELQFLPHPYQPWWLFPFLRAQGRIKTLDPAQHQPHA